MFKKVALKYFCKKEQLIKMSLLNVNKYGWTENSIKLAANELGYSHSLSAVLPNGPLDLIYYNMDNWNKKLSTEINTMRYSNL
jgi:ubiquinone biosynthesis protein COQ9